MAILDTAKQFLFGQGSGGQYTSMAPELVIEQDPATSSQQPSIVPRRITLRQRGLPNDPLKMSGEQRTVTTYYPGSSVATVQVLGPTWGTTTIGGIWKWRFIGGDNGAVVLEGFDDLIGPGEEFSPQLLVLAWEKLRDEGKPLILTWNDQQRRGMLRRFATTWQRPQDVQWEAEFEWISLGPDLIISRAQDLDVPGSAVLDDQIGLDDIAALDPRFLFPDYAAKIVSSINSVRDAVGAVFDTIRFANEQARAPVTALQALATSAESIRLQAEDIIQDVSDRPYTEGSPNDGVIDVLAAENWRRTLGFRTARLRASTQRTARDYQEANAPGQLQIVILPEDKTLRQLAKQFYGDADDWQLIADLNGFVDSQLPAGTAVIIPQKPAQRRRGVPLYGEANT